MPDESTNPVWTTQASQSNQATTNQSWNDFVLDFWDLGDNDAPATEEVQVDLLSEEEKSGDELGFDIDLWTTDQDSSENTEEIKSETDNWTANDVSIDTPEETVNDFDISMDYEWTSKEESVSESTELAENEEKVEDNEEIVLDEETSDEEETIQDEVLNFTTDDTDSKEPVSDNEEIKVDEENEASEDEKVVDEVPVDDNEEKVADEETSDEEEIIQDEVLSFTTDDSGSKEKAEYNEEIVLNDEEKLPENEEIVDDVTEESESQNSERHLFHQVDEEDQNQLNFDVDYSNNENQTFQSDDISTDKALFTGTDDAPTNESEWQEWEITLNSTEVSNNDELLPDMGIEAVEQRQPELWDLLSNSPIDLSKELNDNAEENIDDWWNMEAPVDEVETENNSVLEEAIPDDVTLEPVTENVISEQTPNDVSWEPTLDAVSLEVEPQNMEPESAMSVENNEFLLDAPQIEPEAQKVEESAQTENVENNVEVQQPEQPQADERSEVVNNAVAEMNEPNVSAPEINISAPVELSNVSSSQREATPSESENQVQSTLSLDQILDSELLSNPQYTDNSKASPENKPASGGKGKMWLFIGIWVAALACCVAVLAFPSITSERKSGDTVNTWTTTGYPIWEYPHPSATSEPTDLPDLTGEEPEPIGGWQAENPDFPDFQNVWWWGQVVILPDDGDDSWGDETGTEPVPYVWSGDWDSDEPETDEPEFEEVDADQILDIISSFKSQADTYYSHGEQTADNQLMKYALRLITVCDNYRDKVNNGEGLDYESLSIFKSTANKILSKINTYLGGDEDVPVIREATIDGESYFEGKDELKDYLYNNR